MEKNQNENLNLQLKRGFTALITGLLFSISSPQLMYAKNATAPLLTEEAKILSDKVEQLFRARQKEDWEKIHGLQHPDFRKKVSADEIRYFEGWVASDYREKAKQNAHISGAFVPTLDFIKKNPSKRDPLGFPVPRRYKWSDNPFLKIKTYSLEKISISVDGKYAKVKTIVKGKERLNPMMVRGNFEFDAQYPLTDYWEKVDGEWVITLLSQPVNTSGAGMLKYYVPNNKSGWGKADFVEINPADIASFCIGCPYHNDVTWRDMEAKK